MIILLIAIFAPVPAPKTYDFTGHWVMNWSGEIYTAELSKNGDYVSVDKNGQVWRGKWRYEDEIFIIEECVSGPPQRHTFEVIKKNKKRFDLKKKENPQITVTMTRQTK